MTALRVDVDPAVAPPSVCVRGTRLEESVIRRSGLLSDLRNTEGSFDLPVSQHAFDLWRSNCDVTCLAFEGLGALLKVRVPSIVHTGCQPPTDKRMLRFVYLCTQQSG